MAGEYLTEQEFCERYLISQRTAQRWRKVSGDGPAFVQVGPRRIVYRLVDCEVWAAQQTRQPYRRGRQE